MTCRALKGLKNCGVGQVSQRRATDAGIEKVAGLSRDSYRASSNWRLAAFEPSSPRFQDGQNRHRSFIGDWSKQNTEGTIGGETGGLAGFHEAVSQKIPGRH